MKYDQEIRNIKVRNKEKSIRTLYNSRQKIIDLLNDNAKIRSEQDLEY